MQPLQTLNQATQWNTRGNSDLISGFRPTYSPDIYLFKVSSGNARAIVKFAQISCIALVDSLLTWNK